jgi:hypothetical protein
MTVRERGRGAGGARWAALCAEAARYADGAAALLALRARAPLLPLPAPLRARLLPALAHAAHHHRPAFLHTRESPTAILRITNKYRSLTRNKFLMKSVPTIK